MRRLAMFVALVAVSAPAAQSADPDTKGETAVRDKVEEVLTDAESRQVVHEVFSAGCFNKCWALIDKVERSDADAEDMILAANASLWHWKQRKDCKPMNLSVGYWQLSRVYALADQYAMAEQYGRKCLEVSRKNKLPPFYVGYAYEALARAALVKKDAKKAGEYLAAARSELKKVKEKDERELLEGDLAAVEGLMGKESVGRDEAP